MPRLLDNPAPESTVITDSLKRVRDQLAQVPEGKTGALVIAVDMKSFVPTIRTGIALRTVNGWEIHGEAFLSKAEKGASVVAVKTW
jgi:hypothetical protein